MAAAERVEIAPEPPLLFRSGALIFDPPIKNRLTTSAV
jgi:hypothetical protein